MARVEAFVAIETPRQRVLALIADQSLRERFLPDGWRVTRLLTPKHDVVTSAMEVEAPIGPGVTTRVVQILSLSEDEVVEGPSTAENFVTTWTLRDDDSMSSGPPRRTLVRLQTEFSYGGAIGDFFARRKLRKAYGQMLARLKALAEREQAEEG